MPQRTCIGCRRADDQSALLRLVRRGRLAVDGTSPRAEGRGAYLHSGCIAIAVQRRAIPRAFGPEVQLADEVLALAG